MEPESVGAMGTSLGGEELTEVEDEDAIEEVVEVVEGPKTKPVGRRQRKNLRKKNR